MIKIDPDQPLRVLVVKLTSMGDTLHLLPALSDLRQNYPKVQVDWMIEDSFHEIPAWHPSVKRTIPVSTRRWRSLTISNIREFFSFIKLVRIESYDVIIDAQGLMKSALLARFAKRVSSGERIGMSSNSIKEKPAARLYQRKIDIDQKLHAIDRLRELFAQAFDYSVLNSAVDYAIDLDRQRQSESRQTSNSVTSEQDHIVFIPSTTWASKHLPQKLWMELSQRVLEHDYQIKISWGNQAERQRAEEIADNQPGVEVLPKLSLSELAQRLLTAKGAISVDTGLGHLAAALDVPIVSVYGATDAKLTGAIGSASIMLQAEYNCSPCLLKKCDKLTPDVKTPPCYDTLSADSIWQQLYRQIV